MSPITDRQIIDFIKKDVQRALGCTEPIAVTLAVAKARETLGRKPEIIDIHVSGNILKNGMGVGIPGTDMRGLRVAAALGALTGDSSDALEVLKNVTPEIGSQAKMMVEAGLVNIVLKNNVDKLYVEAVCRAGKDMSRVILEKRHTNIVSVELNDETVFKAEKETENGPGKTDSGKVKGMTTERIVEFAKTASFDDISFILEGVEPNWDIAMYGLEGDFGLKVGKRLTVNRPTEVIDADWMTSAMSKAAAGCDARMAGSIMPVMTNSGSGNQGITIFVPIVDVAQKVGANKDQLARALIIGNAIPIHIKTQIGPLSALCGIVPASTGAACGIAYLMGGDFKQIERVVKYMLANTSGVFCDGAKPACALKVSTGTSAAVQAAIFGMSDDELPYSDGIISDSVEDTIDNLARIAAHGMLQTDIDILDIMTSK
ncbi:UPF0597 protein [Fulvitalea axinellae]|uniref:UPF0597 protein FUAX_20890 n=1 Tax=Fulvitalea axinellae TaxID=1182444 RepID=A0AAU9CNZ0_9BACT|nr:UPF0597 protein [Fulvitalea axinellae]